MNNPASVPSLLLVDDTPADLQLLVGMIRQSGFKARPVPSGKLALQAARQMSPDLILLDIHMPDVDGYQVCEQFKADEKLKDIPIIFLSGLSDPSDKVKAFSVGGVDYITKPFQFEEVEARIKAHLDLHRQKCELVDSYEKLRKLESLRDKLTHMVVHDMRSPLMALDGFLDLLKLTDSNRLSDNGKEYLRYCNQATTGLIEMVCSLLDVSKMEAGQLPLSLAPCALPVLIQEVIQRLESLRENRQIKLVTPSPDLTVTADKTLLLRVLQNLFSNALKFTSENGVVTVTLSSTNTETRIAISDNGPGIPPQFHNKIFEKFGQVEQKTNRIGTGLGLAFCRLAIEAHGGRIGVESEVGKGSCFWFVLPQTQTPPIANPARQGA